MYPWLTMSPSGLKKKRRRLTFTSAGIFLEKLECRKRVVELLKESYPNRCAREEC